jgi:hypothetical protein
LAALEGGFDAWQRMADWGGFFGIRHTRHSRLVEKQIPHRGEHAVRNDMVMSVRNDITSGL